MANNKQKDPAQNIIGKIIWGFVVRIIITIIFGISLGKAVPLLADAFEFTLPGWFKPILIIGSIILGIVLVILYAVRVFKILKAGYLNMEQMAANAAASTFQEITEYTQLPYGQYGGYPPQQNTSPFPQGSPQPAQAYGQTSSYAVPPSNSSVNSNASVTLKPAGCLAKFFIIAMATLMFALPAFSLLGTYFAYNSAIQKYDLCAATVTSVTEHTSTSYDEDGVEHTSTTYLKEYKYTYNSKEYNGSNSSSKYYAENETIEIYVNPDDPTDTFLKRSESDQRTTLIISAVLAVIYLLLLRQGLKLKSRR